tara:strand:- start:201 stop:548 length:348 start_codon:yes stop_codon:yes gene_type:complete
MVFIIMANTYKNVITSLSTTDSTSVYTVPTATVAIIKTISAYNTNGSNAATLTIQITDSSASATKTFDVVDVAAVTKKGFLLNGENIILDEADILKMTAETANYFDIYISVLEIS